MSEDKNMISDTAVEVAARHMLAKAWAEGHKSGFWNGLLSAGDATSVPLIGQAHEECTNPYRSRA